MGRVQLAAINKPASDAGWCPAISTQLVNSTDCDDAITYVKERINGSVSIWAPLKKEKNLMHMSGNKKSAVKVQDKIVDLKEMKNLYGRLMVLAKSSRDTDQVHTISNYEFTLTPRALFAPDGSTLPYTDKSKLIHAFEKLTQQLPISDPKTLPDPTVMQYPLKSKVHARVKKLHWWMEWWWCRN